jgi:hypothetical protein
MKVWKRQSTDSSMKGQTTKKKNLLPEAKEPIDPPPPPTSLSHIVVKPSPFIHHHRRRLKNVIEDDSLDIVSYIQRTPLVLLGSILPSFIMFAFHLSWPSLVRENELSRY